MTSIKNELIGTWELLSYIEVPIDGLDSLFPMGKEPYGILIYAPDGYMSVQIAQDQRKNFESGDKLNGTIEETSAALNSYIAFCGKYKVDNNAATVSYIIKSSLFPNWRGNVQQRKIDFEGDVLYLKSVEPILSQGQLVNSYMTWQKVNKSIDDFFEESMLTDMEK